MHKLATLIDRYSLDVLDHLDRDVDVPVHTQAQCQGDLIVLPTPDARWPQPGVPVPAAGVVLVRGENGGNTHTLLADGPVLHTLVNADLDVCLLLVPDGATAYLAHPEHGYAGIGAGCYTVRRQREQADVIRQVAD